MMFSNILEPFLTKHDQQGMKPHIYDDEAPGYNMADLGTGPGSTSDNSEPRGHQHRQQTTQRGWKRAFMRSGPLLDISALVVVFINIPAAAYVLMASDEEMVEKWTYQPSVYLSILTGIGNKALGFAAIQGTLLTWWLRSMEGTTMAKLHYDWAAGSGLWSAISAGKQTSILSLSTICATAILLDGILLQQATTVIQRTATNDLALKSWVPQEVPANYSGFIAKVNPNGNWTHPRLTDAAFDVDRDFNNGSPIPSMLSGCSGICRATIPGPALVEDDCAVVSSTKLNLTAITSSNLRQLPEVCTRRLTAYDVLPRSCPLMTIYISMPRTAQRFETVSMTIGYTDNNFGATSAGFYTLRNCTFRPAIVQYTVVVNATNAASPTMRVDFSDRKLLAYANNTLPQEFEAFNDWHPSTFVGAALLAGAQLNTDIRATWPHVVNATPSFSFGQARAWRLLQNRRQIWDPTAPQWPIWEDPLQSGLELLNEFVFRFSVHAAQHMDEDTIRSVTEYDLAYPLEISGQRIDPVPIFQTRWRFYFAAAALQIICIAVIASLYWGYWRLGREVSFSPLEMAKAFRSEVVDGVQVSVGSEIAEEVGDVDVIYKSSYIQKM